MRGFWDELTGRFPRVYGTNLAEIESNTESKVDNLLKGLSSTQLDELLKTIQARRGLIDTNPAYGNEIVSTSKQILAFGGAGVGLVAAFAHNFADLPSSFFKVVCIGALFYFNLVALSLFTILEFVWLTRFRYPFLYFRKIGNTVPFFYYQAISPDVPRAVFQTAEDKLLAAKLYGEDLVSFIRHLIPEIHSSGSSEAANDSPDTGLKQRVVRDELQQYFLLLAYQGYVNQYEVRMNNQFFYGLIASVISSGLVAICAFVFF